MSYTPPAFDNVAFQPPGAVRYPAPAFDQVEFPPVPLVAFDCLLTASIDADAIAYSDSEVRFNIPVLWRIDIGSFGDSSIRTRMRVGGRINTDSTPVYSFVESGSVKGRIRVSGRIRTGA